MIKRLFRKKLRCAIWSYKGAKNPEYEEYVNWIYNAPLWDWEVMKTCVLHTSTLQEAKELFFFFSK